MVKSQKLSTKSFNKTVKCAICHNDINNFSVIYQPQFNLGVVCADCQYFFSPEDITSVLELFLLYGGYFGQLQGQKFSLIRELKKIDSSEFQNKSVSIDEIIIEVNSLLLHRALLHGLCPEDYIEKLRKFLDDTSHDYVF